MNDIEQKALALVNEVGDPQGFAPYIGLPKSDITNALCRAIEQHEAFRQEVSDAVVVVTNMYPGAIPARHLAKFIIPKPDPLVEVLNEISHEGGFDNFNHYAHRLRSALDALGFEIKEKGK